MDSWFDRSAPGRALNWIAALPVRLLSPIARGKELRIGSEPGCAVPLSALCALMLCVPHQHWNNLYGVLLAAVLLILYWWDCAARGRNVLRPGELGWGLWVFLAMCVICSLRADYPAGSFRVASFYFAGAVLCYVAAAVGKEVGTDWVLVPWVYAALLFTAVYGLWIYRQGGDAYGVPMGDRILPRLGSTLEHAINYSEFEAMALPICLVWAARRPRRQRLFLLAPLLLPCAALALTYARTGWIALGAAALILLLYWDVRLLIPAAGLGTVGLLLLPADIKSRLLSVFTWTNSSASGRFILWRECFAMLRRHWAGGIGLGPENFYSAYLPFSTGMLEFQPPHANMGYLEIFLSLGIIGFIAFLSFFFRVFPMLARDIAGEKTERRWELIALTAALTGAAIANIPEHLWFYPRILFFWCVLWGTAVGRTTDEVKDRPGRDA